MVPPRPADSAHWEDGGILVVDVTGELDADRADRLCGPLLRMARIGQRHFVVDLAAVESVHADGALRFAEAALRMGAGGAVLAVVARTTVRRALLAAGAGRLTGGLHPTLADALAACRARNAAGRGRPTPDSV
ncbi:STAS domain-containing protein [Streptomyces sp. NPDC050145]|uniref:STAS domain-containing protein n=1 Tax=Streptomyces sp. NPDC050145 TaxID=3365602 RepID=UPI0037B48125